LEKLANHAIGKQRIAAADGVETGWIAGDHILDTQFDLAKNIVNDALVFDLRIDQQKIPGDLLRAYTQVELHALAGNNPSGHPSAKQKREARENAREKLEHEAADGRYLRRKSVSVMWDGQSNELLVGTTSIAVVDRLLALFQLTFERGFNYMVQAGKRSCKLRGVDTPAAWMMPGHHRLSRGKRSAKSPGSRTKPPAIFSAMNTCSGFGMCWTRNPTH